MVTPIIISGTGLYIPPNKISNEELVESFNQYVDTYNQQHKNAIAKGELTALEYSSASFIEKASGIFNRYVMDKKGILDPHRMRPSIAPRQDNEISIQCEIALKAIHAALDVAQKTPQEVDAIIVSSANTQRSYPGIAMEIQHHLGASGFGYDMNVACSSTTFGMATAYNFLQNPQHRCIVVVNPEITSGHINFRDRDSHFIFGDVCTAVVMEQADYASRTGFEVLSYKLQTSFSNNIRNNGGFLNHTEVDTNEPIPRHCFKQNGRKVFKEVIPLAQEHILAHLTQLSLLPEHIKRYWLHQANLNMNELIIKKILGTEPQPLEAPTILHEFANTASCGSIVAFHRHHHDLHAGDQGLICSFGAGYSIGSLIVKKQ